MTSSNIKNHREKARHQVLMSSLSKEQKMWEIQAKRDINSTRSELLAMLAYRKVYRDYSFYKQQEQQEHRDRARTPAKVSFRVAHHDLNEDSDGGGGRRAIASERILRRPRDQQVNASPTARSADFQASKGILRQQQSNRGNNSVDNVTQSMSSLNLNQSVTQNVNAQSGPARSCANVLVIKPGEDEDETRTARGKQKYAVLQAKTFFRTPKVRSNNQSPRRSVFPEECRNIFALRRLMDDKAGKLINDWSPEMKRKREVKKILAKVTFPQLVSRQQTTSAIFRDYRHIKERGGRKYSPALRRKSSAKEVSFDISKILKLPPMTQEEKVSMMSRADRPDMPGRSTTVT